MKTLHEIWTVAVAFGWAMALVVPAAKLHGKMMREYWAEREKANRALAQAPFLRLLGARPAPPPSLAPVAFFFIAFWAGGLMLFNYMGVI